MKRDTAGPMAIGLVLGLIATVPAWVWATGRPEPKPKAHCTVCDCCKTHCTAAKDKLVLWTPSGTQTGIVGRVTGTLPDGTLTVEFESRATGTGQ